VRPVEVTELSIQRAEVIEIAQPEATKSTEPENSSAPLTHVKAMQAEEAQKIEQEPGDIIIQLALSINAVGIPIHRGNEEEINNPTDEKEASGEGPDNPSNRPTIIKTMRACESKNPQDITHELTMRIVSCIHNEIYLS